MNLPNGWGSDELSRFIGLAHQNEQATFANKKEMYRHLSAIDSIYQNLCEKLINPQQILPALLFLRAHSSYRGGVRLALSGEVAESFALGRSCLEYALYSYHITKFPGSGHIWIKRHDSDENRKKCRNEFSYNRVLSTFKKYDSVLGEKLRIMYERCIDYGGHPNEKALTTNMKIDKTEEGHNLVQLYLTGDSPLLDYGLRNIADVGLAVLLVYRNIWIKRFDILGITDQLNQFIFQCSE